MVEGAKIPAKVTGQEEPNREANVRQLDQYLSINPDPQYFIRRPGEPLSRIKAFIESSGSGVIGLTGVRGAGKSMLLNKIIADFGGEQSKAVGNATDQNDDENSTKESYFTLPITAPTTSKDETAFFVMLYKRLCETVISELNAKYFKKKRGAEELGRKAEQIAWAPFTLILILTGALCLWGVYLSVCGRSFDQQKKEAASITEKIENNLSAGLNEALEDKISQIQNQLLKGAPGKDSDQAADILEELMQELTDTKVHQRLVEELIRQGEAAKAALGPLMKLTDGDMPHPAQMVIINEDDGEFDLARDFLEPRGVPREALHKVGLSPEAANVITDQTKKALEEILTAYGGRKKGMIVYKDFLNAVFNLVPLSEKDTFNKTTRQLLKLQDEFEEKSKRTESEIQSLETNIAKAAQSESLKKKAEISAARISITKVYEEEFRKIRSAASGFNASVASLQFSFREHILLKPPVLPFEKEKVIQSALEFKTAISELGGFITDNSSDNQDVVDKQTKIINSSIEQLSQKLSEPYLFTRLRKFKDEAAFAVVVGAALSVIAGLMKYSHHLWRMRRKYRLEFGLIKLSEEKIAKLDFDITRTRSGRFNIPILKNTATISASEQLKGRALNLPGLTSDYMGYIKEVQKVLEERTGNPKLLICIDELDKISQSEEVERVLREIKGALFQDNCFYLFSISEDAVQAFESRFIEERDIFESTFDEIFFLGRLDIETCLKIARKRFEAPGCEWDDFNNIDVKQSVMIAAILSAGVPREFLRNLRVMVSGYQDLMKVEPQAVWCKLFLRKIKESRRRIQVVNILESLRAGSIIVLDRLIDEHIRFKDRASDELYSGRALIRRVELVSEQSRLIKSRTDRLIKELQEELSDAQRERLQFEKNCLEIWRKSWMEVLIHLLCRQSYLGCTDIQKNESVLEKEFSRLLFIYGTLPYNSEVSAKYLEEVVNCYGTFPQMVRFG